ncbi:hypothetical protein [Labilibaculum euxinus]|uniref:PKD domain-containing protein n=1 Tax=Labilibaculum euxinus TaxID=2686357 RepID=A0A7M4DAH3_9BACT|nr:hypothetical protein [Labilibaculum euxinus]MUP39652.1 hypothetical protein [Labilibaculum euxinus]MVB08857.1 hypothetical protein [Labilibaculum euxinus]
MKRLLKITLVLAISLIAFGTYAQDATHNVFSKHTFKVNLTDPSGDHTGNTYTWAVLNAAGTADAATGTFSFITGPSAVDLNEVEIQWLASGDYLVQVSEQNASGACTTLRQISIKVNSGDVDLMVEACDASGTPLVDYTAPTPDLATLSTCNDKSGDIITRGSDDFGSSVRYFKVSMTAGGVAWTQGTWKFDYVTTAGTVTSTDATVAGTNVAVALGTSSIILKVDVPNTPGPVASESINLNLTASTISINTNTGDVNETGTVDNNKAKDAIIILPSPKTSDISID